MTVNSIGCLGMPNSADSIRPFDSEKNTMQEYAKAKLAAAAAKNDSEVSGKQLKADLVELAGAIKNDAVAQVADGIGRQPGRPSPGPTAKGGPDTAASVPYSYRFGFMRFSSGQQVVGNHMPWSEKFGFMNLFSAPPSRTAADS